MRRSTSIDFAENQLFPSLIGLSPLATAHPRLFQQAWVRPPVGVTPPSAWPWLDHSVSGLPPATERPVQTRFRSAFAYRLKLAANGNSLTHYTKGTPSRYHDPHLSMGAPRPLRLLVGIRFQVSFTPLIGVLFTFPSRYLFAIGHQGVFRLGGWSPHLQTGFHVSRLTQGLSDIYVYGAVTRYGRTFQTVLLILRQPLACSAFARHY